MAYENFQQIKQETSAKMDKSIEVFKGELAGLRTGRASVALLDGIEVVAYGAPTPLNQVASLSTPDARTISVSVWDKTIAPAVEKAIRESGLGLNPASDGTLIRVPLPALTEERRKELAKVAAQYAEQAKQSVRHVRQDAMEAVKQVEKSEDDRRRGEEEIQKLTEKYNALIAETLEAKQKDIMSI